MPPGQRATIGANSHGPCLQNGRGRGRRCVRRPWPAPAGRVPPPRLKEKGAAVQRRTGGTSGRRGPSTPRGRTVRQASGLALTAHKDEGGGRGASYTTEDGAPADLAGGGGALRTRLPALAGARQEKGKEEERGAGGPAGGRG